MHKATDKISLFLGAPVSIKEISLDLFANISLNGFCIQTHKKDTILFTPQLKLRLNTFSFSSRFLEIRSATFVKPNIHFYVDSTSTINFQFIIDKLTPKDTTPSAHPMVVSVRKITIQEGNFFLKGFYNIPRAYGVNFADIHLPKLNVEVTNFRVDNGISMNIRNLSFTDKCGIKVEKMSCLFIFQPKKMVFNHLSIRTPLSNIHAKQVQLLYASPKELRPIIFGKNVKLNIELEPSDIASDDIAWFLPILKDYDLKVRASGKITGVLSALKCRDLDITYGTRSSLKANLDINGLPNIQTSFMHVDFKSLYTIPSDIESINIPQSASGKIHLPLNFKKIAFLSYHGQFTGYINDFVAYGTIHTNLGEIETDLLFKPDTSDYFHLNGRLKTIDFDIGTFAGQSPLLGKISMNAMINAQIGGINPKAQMDGVVNSFMFNGYNYKNIAVNGTMTGKTFDGSLNITDPNLQLDFLGKVDLSKQSPEFNFTANVQNANLHPLNIDKKDTTSKVSFSLVSAFSGNKLDDLKGNLRLYNIAMERNGKKIAINYLSIINQESKLKNQFLVHSDFLDAEMWGIYKFSELAGSLRHFVRLYAPSLFPESSKTIDTIGNYFCFKVDFKDTRLITDFLVPGLYISQDSKLSGIYDMGMNNFNFRMNVPLLQHTSRKFYNVYLSGRTIDHKLSIISGCDSLQVNHQFNFPNLTILVDIAHDSIDSRIRWNNWDSTSYRGNINLLATLKPSSNNKYPKVDAQLLPSFIVLSDTLWKMPSGALHIDTSSIAIDQFLITHGNQKLQIQGKVSENLEDELHIDLYKVNLSNLGTIINTSKFSFGGIINGGINFYNLYHNPAFKSQIDVDTLIFNQVPIGKTNVSATFSNSEKVINIDAWTDRNGLKTINVKGQYYLPTQMLNFNINLEKLKLDPFEPYLAVLFSNVRGKVSGKLTLKGPISNPIIAGAVNAQKVGFRVKYLNTQYNLSDSVFISNNTFKLKDVKVFDDEARTAIVNGSIEYRKLKELYVDLGIKATNFHCLNTTKKDNNLFYGKAYATGTVLIDVSPKGVNLDVDATSNPNTQISIPVETRTELSEANYIHFRTKEKTKENLFNQYEIDRTSSNTQNLNSSMKFGMNLTLHATPDANVNIVFDEKSGDEIKGTGSGDLNLTLESGNFKIDGIYTVKQGEYLYTSQRIINKRFVIQDGGSIAWTGNPLDAIINIEAIYNLRSVPIVISNETKRVSVDCKISISDKLLKPNVKYGIDFPNADQEVRNQVNQYISTDEDMTNQFISLLFTGNFYKTEQSTAGSNTGGAVGSMIGIELLSNQLLRMMRQGNKGIVDIGIDYKPGDQQGNNQLVEVAISKQFLNDRLSVSTNIDYGKTAATSATSTNTSGALMEGYMEYKVTKNGKVRLKAFNRANQSYEDNSTYSQGVGIFYKEDFNSFGELWHHLFRPSARKEEDSTAIKKASQ